MTHARCCCDPDGPIECDNGDPVPAGCYLVTISGVQAASCSAFSFSPNREWRVTTLSVPVSFVIEADGIESNSVTNRVVPVVAKLTSYDINDGAQEEQLFYCEANIRVRIACVRPGPVGTPRYWFYEVSGSLASACGGDGFGQPFNKIFFGGRVVVNDGEPIGTPIASSNTNGEGCYFVGTGGVALVQRIGDCNAPGPVVYARSCDGSEMITVDLNTRDTIEASTVEYQGRLYELTNDPSTEEPVSVLWVDRSCEDEPDPEGHLFQVCGIGPVPEFVRVNTDESVDFVEVSILGDWYPVSGSRECRDRYKVTYQRVIDEGQPASNPSSFLVVGGCVNVRVLERRVVCRVTGGDDAGRPTRPGGISLIDPGDRGGGGETRTKFGTIDPNHDPETEARALRQGGDCGCSRYSDEI